MKKRTGIIHIVCIVLAAAVAQVFFLLCLKFFPDRFAEWLYLLTLIGGSALNVGLLTLDIVSFFKQKEFLYKACIIAYTLIVFAGIVLYILLKTGFMEIAGDEELLKEYLSHTGIWMGALFVLLQFLQVVILPIPSTVTVLAGAALFGPFVGSLLSLAGIFLGSLVAFLVGRYAGIRVVEWIVGKEILRKWLKKIEGKDKLLLSVMFLLPVFPDDVLCFVAGLSSMSVWLFLGVILVSRVIAIFTTSFCVEVIPYNTWWGLLIWAAIGLLVLLLFVVLYKKSDAILDFFAKKFHRETRIKEKTEKGEFTLEVVGPDGAIVEKGVKREEKEK